MTEAMAETLRYTAEIRSEAKKEGIINTLLRIYEQRLGPVPDSVGSALFAIDEPDRLTALLPLLLSGDADTIAHALLS